MLDGFVTCAELSDRFDMRALGAGAYEYWAVPTAIECEFRELDELKTGGEHTVCAASFLESERRR